MKIAQLPDGEELEFPDETDDEHISAAVRKRLGLAPAGPSPQEQQSAQQMAVMMAIAQQAGILVRSLQNMANQIAETNQMLTSAIAALTTSADAMAKAASQPRKLTVQRDKDGKAQTVLSVPQGRRE